MFNEELVSSLNPWWRDPDARAAREYPVRRDVEPVLLRHLRDLGDRRAFALVGPRQVGKTTILLQLVDDLLDAGWPGGNITYFDFSDPRVTEEVVASEVAEALPATVSEEYPSVLLFDEISRSVHWDRWLKSVVDRGSSRIGVTDSAASLLRAGSIESGQGRWDEYRIEGLNFREALRLWSGENSGGSEEPDQVLARLPNLFERYLAIGGFPEHLHREDLRSVRNRIRDDIAQRAIYRDLAREGIDVDGVRRLFVFLVQESGAIFRLTRRASQLDRDSRTVKGWLQLLEQAALITSLPRFAVRSSSRMRGSRRFYATDHGLVRAFTVPSARSERTRSRVFEAVVFRHLRDLQREHGAELSFFRQKQDLEVDFVLQLPDRRLAVEVTSSESPRDRKIERLTQAVDELRADQRFLISGGLVRSESSGVRVLPLREFLLRPSLILELQGS